MSSVITGGVSSINFALVQHIHNAGAFVLIADSRLTIEAKVFVKSTFRNVFQLTDVTKRAHQNRLIDVSKARTGDVPHIVRDSYVAVAARVNILRI